MNDWGFDVWQEPKKEAKKSENNKQPNEEQERADFFDLMLGDRIYDSDNEFDIPTLRTDRQPENGILLPFAGWGADTRAKKGISTYHFYVEDYRFTAIWKDPTSVLKSGCTNLVEPNLSLFDTTPIAYGLQLIYMKRWIARFWQECGAKVYADLNVSQKFYKWNRMGIPDGYNAFATRGYADREEYLKMEIQTAREISGLDKPNMIVYGGGERIREICLQNNVLYVEQFMTNKNIKKKGVIMAKTSGSIRGGGTRQRVMSEEQYLASMGYGRAGFGDVALAKGNYRNGAGRAILERQNQKDMEYFNTRARLREDYNRLVSSGQIRQPTRIEQLMQTAQGNSDNEAVRAARRALEKRGIDWRRRRR